jgi:hypothetical protein
MSQFRRKGSNGWVAKFIQDGTQHWVPGGPWATKEEAAEAERKLRQSLADGKDQGSKWARWRDEERRKAERIGRPHSVYRFFAGDELIYVGITSGGIRRLGQHQIRKEWWPQVTHATFAHFTNGLDADAEETRLIEKYRPKYNILKQPETIPDGMVSVEDIGQHLKLKPQTVKQMVREGLLPKAGDSNRGRPYFSISDVDKWMIAGKAERKGRNATPPNDREVAQC